MKVCAALMNTVCVNPPAGNNIGDPGAKDLSVFLANCPKLHTLNLSGE